VSLGGARGLRPEGAGTRDWLCFGALDSGRFACETNCLSACKRVVDVWERIGLADFSPP